MRVCVEAGGMLWPSRPTTIAQMCEATGTSDFTVAKHLKLAGAEKRYFVVQTAKAFRRIPHYHLK